jgi:hypothetical protein
MFRSDSSDSLSDFVRNYKRYQADLRASGRPHLLTVGSSPELVVQDVRAYQSAVDERLRLEEENSTLMERLAEVETLRALNEAYSAMQQGRSRTLGAALPDLRQLLERSSGGA